MEEREFEFPRAKKDTCCIHKQLIANHLLSIFAVSNPHLCASNNKNRGILTYLVCPRRNKFINPNTPFPQDSRFLVIIQRIEYHIIPIIMRVKLRRAFVTREAAHDQDRG